MLAIPVMVGSINRRIMLLAGLGKNKDPISI
jgi:hypothetical protein